MNLQEVQKIGYNSDDQKDVKINSCEESRTTTLASAIVGLKKPNQEVAVPGPEDEKIKSKAVETRQSIERSGTRCIMV